MNSSLRRALVTSGISLALFGVVVVVEMVGKQPSSQVVKALAVLVMLMVATIPLGGGAITLLAARENIAHRDRVVQAVIATLIAVVCVVAGIKWLAWLADPRGDPPGIHTEEHVPQNNAFQLTTLIAEGLPPQAIVGVRVAADRGVLDGPLSHVVSAAHSARLGRTKRRGSTRRRCAYVKLPGAH